jgi:hypothetical protein
VLADQSPATQLRSLVLPNRSYPGIMICPYAVGQFLGERDSITGRSPAANISTPIYAYLPAQERMKGLANVAAKVPFSAMRSEYDSNSIRNCPGAINLDGNFEPNYSQQSTGRLPTLLGPIGSTASNWLVRNTEDISNWYGQPRPTPAGWNQCQIFDINTVAAGTPDRCNIMKDIGNPGVVRIQELNELISTDLYNRLRTDCSKYPLVRSADCGAVIGGPFTREGGYSVFDPAFFQTDASVGVSLVGYALILYDSDDGPPKELDFSVVGTDAMSSTQKVSSRTIFERQSTKVSTKYWDVQVQISIQHRYLTAADALAGRYTTKKEVSYLWLGLPTGFNPINIQFSSLFTTVFDDQVAVTALATFVAIVSFAVTIWGKRDTAVNICQFVWKKYSECRARKETVQDVPLK